MCSVDYLIESLFYLPNLFCDIFRLKAAWILDFRVFQPLAGYLYSGRYMSKVREQFLPAAQDASSMYDDNGSGRITCAEARRHSIAWPSPLA